MLAQTDIPVLLVAVFQFYIFKVNIPQDAFIKVPQRKGFVLHNLKTFLFFPSKKKVLKQILATELI